MSSTENRYHLNSVVELNGAITVEDAVNCILADIMAWGRIIVEVASRFDIKIDTYYCEYYGGRCGIASIARFLSYPIVKTSVDIEGTKANYTLTVRMKGELYGESREA